MWPSAMQSQELLDYTQVDHANGYDFSMSIRFKYANGLETIWQTTGEVRNYSWGQESVLDITVQGMPPSLPPERIARQIKTKTINGQRQGQMKQATVERTITFLDGRSETRKDVQTLVADVPKLSQEQTAEAMRRAFAGEALDQAFFGRKLKP